MDARKKLIIVNGKDKSDSVASFSSAGGKCNIVYSSSSKVYSYNSGNVQILDLKGTIDPSSVIVTVKGRPLSGVEQILDFGDFYRFIRSGKKDLSYHRSELVFEKNCLAGGDSLGLFEYFKETAGAVSLVTENGINILSRQYEKITAVSESTVLAKYLNRTSQPEKRDPPPVLIYPFGLNQSQKAAVENAFSSQVSIIQGPPGTGKTQTILNIIANAVRNGKTVAVVSNNNSATLNVAEKLEKRGVSFLTAFLGSLANKGRFLETQTGKYPDMSAWAIEREAKVKLDAEVKQLSEELNDMLNAKNRIAEIEQELLALKPEQHYFEEYSAMLGGGADSLPSLSGLSADKILSLWLEYEHFSESGAKLGWVKKLAIIFRFNRAALSLFSRTPDSIIPYLQRQYYIVKQKELHSERETLEGKLKQYRFEPKMDELSQKSMQLFRAELAGRYRWQASRPIFESRDFRGNSDGFNGEYPVILSTTYSIKGTLSMSHIYDYLIIDEASQVDAATGVLAFSCARNVVIVGDQKQLPNVLTEQDIQTADAIWNRRPFDEAYHFTTHSLLSSAVAVWHEAPTVLLREHYRCHPKIAGFFNQKFYDDQLIVMTEDRGEKDALAMYRTAAGNHARGHLNQRQIDVIRDEVLPKLEQNGHHDIGIITPYRDQVAAISSQLGAGHEVATVHKFQGREKDAIVLASVDNVITEFVDDPRLLNVAVSRAVKSLSIVMSLDERNERTNFGDLAKYIEYNNFEIVTSKVFSVFDMLYKGYARQRREYLRKHKRISEYDSENLMYAVLSEVLRADEFSGVDFVIHSSLSTLVKDYSLLNEEEARYAGNPLTHLDFLLFNKMDKAPIMAIEVDGVAYHAVGGKQAERDALKNSILAKCGVPLLRIRTDESGEKGRIESMLRQSI